MDFLEIIILDEIDKYSLGFYQSSLVDDYDLVTKENSKEFAIKALEQFNIMFKYKNISGFFIVDWRVNFFKLFEYFVNNKLAQDKNIIVLEFMNVYKSESADLLYKRLGME